MDDDIQRRENEQRAMLSSSRALEMSTGRDRSGPPACTNASAKDPNSDTARASSRPKDSNNRGSKG
jgi:hypothetical protein